MPTPTHASRENNKKVPILRWRHYLWYSCDKPSEKLKRKKPAGAITTDTRDDENTKELKSENCEYMQTVHKTNMIKAADDDLTWKLVPQLKSVIWIGASSPETRGKRWDTCNEKRKRNATRSRSVRLNTRHVKRINARGLSANHILRVNQLTIQQMCRMRISARQRRQIRATMSETIRRTDSCRQWEPSRYGTSLLKLHLTHPRHTQVTQTLPNTIDWNLPGIETRSYAAMW